jgi:hypothetical protein
MRKPKVLKYKVGDIVKKKYCGVWVNYLIVGTQRGRLPYLIRRVGAKPADWSIYESEQCLRGKDDYLDGETVSVCVGQSWHIAKLITVNSVPKHPSGYLVCLPNWWKNDINKADQYMWVNEWEIQKVFK